MAANTDICEQITKYKTINTILTMIYHFSAKFNNDPITYHGEFDTIYEPDKLNDSIKDKILRQAKNELLNRMRGYWQKDDRDITMYQVYTHNRPLDLRFKNKVNEVRGGDGSEIEVFRFEKEDKGDKKIKTKKHYG